MGSFRGWSGVEKLLSIGRGKNSIFGEAQRINGGSNEV